MGLVLKSLAGVVLAALLGVVITFQFVCPCVRMPGGSLSGQVMEAPVADWSGANDVPLCQLEVDGVIAWSVNLNCMAADGQLFVSCSRCEGKVWSDIALQNANGRIRLGDRVFPVTMERVTESDRLDIAWQARAQKLGREPQPRPDHWWSFHLTSRSSES